MDQTEKREVVALFDHLNQLDRSEDPPGVPDVNAIQLCAVSVACMKLAYLAIASQGRV